MKAINGHRFLRIWLIIFAVLCASFGFGAIRAGSEVAHAAGGSVSTNVYIGDMIEAKNYRIGNSVVAEGMRIVYPSGGIYGSEKFAIDQAGKYQVTYYATVNGQRVEETKTYLAIRRPQDMIVADKGMQVEYGMFYVESPYQLTKDTYGALVHFKAGQSITFATNLKTADLTAGFNFLEMIVQPSVYGETDFTKLRVIITDTEDENNFVEYVIESSNVVDGWGMTSYVKAGASGRQYGGYEGSKFHTNTYGTSVFHSFRGWSRVGEDPSNKTIAEGALTLAIDQETKKVYCGPYSNQSDRNLMVNDLDDPTRYKSDPWEGFTSDEVSVTVKAEGFSKSEGVLMIKSFGGYNFANNIIDNDAPIISFDYDMTDELPVAQVETDFRIIPFTAKDNLDKTVKTNVWVNHINQNGKRITVENDGESFFVEYEGRYEIIYRAEDYSGNATEQRIEITAQAALPDIIVIVEQPLVEANVYETVEVPYASDLNIYGGSGTLKIERAVYSPSNEVLDVKNRLQLTEVGDYRVVYRATDYYGRVGYGRVTIRSASIVAPKFVETPQFAPVLIKGFTYDFPEALAVETVNGEVFSLPCKTYVNGALKNGSFIANGTEMLIRYVAEGTTGSVVWEDVISVVDTEKGKYRSRYFYTTDDLDIIDEKNDLEFAFDSDAKATFINPVSIQEFSVMLFYEAAKTNFSEMTFTLTDAANSNLSVTFHFFYNKTEGKWTMQLNDGADPVAFAESKGILSFIYSAKNGRIIDASGEEIAVIALYDNGDAFNGFSDTVYFDIAFAGVSGQSSMYFTQICNQSMGYGKSSIDKAKDETDPIIVLDDAFLLRQKLGSTAVIPTAKAFDVLSQISEFTIYVETKDGELIASGAGNEKLSFLLDKAGSYSVTYRATDTSDNTMSLNYMILVSDETAPTLTVNNNLKDKYRVGDRITIPNYSATDNGDKYYIQVMVILPDDEMRLLHYYKNENGEVTLTSLLSRNSEVYNNDFKVNDNTFKTIKKGSYVLRIVAYDDDYNYTVWEFKFQVQ